MATLKLKAKGIKGFFLKKDKLPEGVHQDHHCFKTLQGTKLKGEQGSFFLSSINMVDDGLAYQELIYRYQEPIKRRAKRTLKIHDKDEDVNEDMSDGEVQPLQ
jgi:hypothetical protein